MKDVPFHTQAWASDAWSALGFEREEDAAYWKASCCGILCVKMAGEALGGERLPPLAELIRRGQDLDAYTHERGWSHAGLAQLAGTLGMTATAREPLTVEDLRRELDAGGLVVASVKSGFKTRRSLKERLLGKTYGGHLALVFGHDERGFYVHHTSIRPEKDWRDEFIPAKRFVGAYTNRGIVLAC